MSESFSFRIGPQNYVFNIEPQEQERIRLLVATLDFRYGQMLEALPGANHESILVACLLNLADSLRAVEEKNISEEGQENSERELANPVMTNSFATLLEEKHHLEEEIVQHRGLIEEFFGLQERLEALEERLSMLLEAFEVTQKTQDSFLGTGTGFPEPETPFKDDDDQAIGS